MVDKTAPTLVTSRLIIDALTKDDFDSSYETWSDPIAVKYVGGDIRTRRDVWFRLLNKTGLWPLLGFGYWAVRLKGTGELLGEVGFADFRREMNPDISAWPEAGWAFRRKHWGNGYATEAIAAIHKWMDGQSFGGETVCIIHPDHAASIRVAEKVGYKVAWESTFESEATLVLRRSTCKSFA